MHEGVRYPYNLCNFEARQKVNFKVEFFHFFQSSMDIKTWTNLAMEYIFLTLKQSWMSEAINEEFQF